MEPSKNYWRKCTTCKKEIGFTQRYWICSVSTCNRIRTGLVFCTVECFDAHVPVLNHRDAGAYEKKAPSEAQWKAEPASLSTPAVSSDDILVVVSKVKGYIRARSGMNTSESVMALLSNEIRAMANDAIHSAERNGRRTVLDRDVS